MLAKTLNELTFDLGGSKAGFLAGKVVYSTVRRACLLWVIIGHKAVASDVDLQVVTAAATL